jgi:indolepyruvate ferredoxin oxidoreductase beta subunit
MQGLKGLNIMIVGVGGQGTLLASRVLGAAALSAGYEVKVSEVHGMSQRGGSVVTYVRFGDNISSPLVDKGEADIILCFEQLEALRYLEYLKQDGTIIVSEQIIDPMPVITGVEKYPSGIIPALKEALGDRAIAVNAADIARECGDIRAVNIVLIGVMAGLGIGGISREIWDETLKEVVPPKSLSINQKAFEKGHERGKG